MAAPVVEAKSLSSLTALAFNPPSYPRNPTHFRHDPLVLYIARVPGSRDVFLSPMKPREKVVTAEDIQSSLYYVHVNQPEDAYLVDPPELRGPDAVGQNPSSVPLVPRKAVPGTSNAVPPMRKPVPGTLAPIDNYSNSHNISAGNFSQRPGVLASDYSSPRRSFDSTQHQQENEKPPPLPRRRSENPPREPPSLTLIRRDPASGAQWNVARIEDPPIVEISSSALRDPTNKKRSGAPMYIQVFNPGYSKFLHSDSSDKSQPPLVSRDSGFSTQSWQKGHSGTVESQASGQVASDNVFRRRIWLEGSQHLGHAFGHRKNSSYDANYARPSSKGSYTGQAERPSMDLRSPFSPSFQAHDDQAHGNIQVSERQTSFRGYVFTSPWNGRCEFVTGVGGGSLKCRHIIPGLQGAPISSASLSELRFNLPSGPKRSAARGAEASKRSSFFRRGRHSRNNSIASINVEENNEDRMDLSLGQEFAGGGMGGKQAKLGKIILEDEGLKMMDLLVAANMALWWRAYEKANGGSRSRNDSMDL
ncbi:hypothetical protein COCC4DRAFT_72868 [Bipolaris maydis ATCC 48331]|uniref:Uncharacterized protein n=2 Tax=Cochliobolus heterostrophus TaxID=5016 RepID=M2TIA1_COCH5|nr:uncharacterized protein COCC4DRAFT_72868 [Bipolaris maydis ATCC 48331]EMD97165.1 hypothetical protein COCHEDRAFT_1190073 [Bipolaris maydis C5]KAJ5029611.1 hypothetical protein J3E73DRAFT_379484 [Bipolaris maydis]ENI04373.1 hypothetical protein COCC4DRAFT_72868 [Bipolaris maydis ATCC 48331]KAJ5061637.1 hypothetical protein J3E74DRAFT_240845 [Bipolaris maydis]KAJ6203246.1 hypothetical protein J3E72DRAFT_427795 [Bipolaris maydis]